jgi:protein TonB
MARRLKLKMRTPLARSLVVHLILLVAVVFVVYFEPHPTQDPPIQIETISLEQHVKRAIHKVIHTVGLPHEEIDDDVISPQTKTSVQTQSSLSQSESAESEEGGGIAPSEMQKYIIEIVNRIQRTKQYPKDAQFNEQEGMVEILIEVAPNGQITKAVLTKKTPFESLNQAALSAVQKLGVLPPLPARPDGTPATRSVSLHIPIHFQLK